MNAISPLRRAHIVTAHPDEQSLTLAVTDRLAQGVREGGVEVTVDNLVASGFHSAYTPADLAGYRGFYAGQQMPAAADIAAHHRILDDSQALVLVFPVYWWSMPSQMKGWLERVLSGTWLWKYGPGATRTAFSDLAVHLVPLTGSTEASYQRHGYQQSMVTQIEHGIFEYIYAGSTTWHWLWNAANDPEQTLTRAYQAAEAVLRAGAPARAATVTTP